MDLVRGGTHARQGCTMARNSVRARGARVERVFHRSRIRRDMYRLLKEFCRRHLRTVYLVGNLVRPRTVEHSSHSCTTGAHRVTSHCAPFSRMCASTCKLHMPQCPRRGPTGHPKAPKWPYIGSKWDQSGVNIDPHCAKQFKMGQTVSKLVHRLQDGYPGGTNSPNLA